MECVCVYIVKSYYVVCTNVCMCFVSAVYIHSLWCIILTGRNTDSSNV